MSGSETISMRPVPALLRSIYVKDSRASDVDLPVSYGDNQTCTKDRIIYLLVPAESALCELQRPTLEAAMCHRWQRELKIEG